MKDMTAASMNTEAVNDRPLHCWPVANDTGDTVCAQHGGYWTPDGCLTEQVLKSVAAHRHEQFRRWGSNRDVVDGTGPEVHWLTPVVSAAANQGYRVEAWFTAESVEVLFREEWDYIGDGTDDDSAVTWLRMLREEVAEAFKESDPDRLEAELTQVAALATSWIERLRERKMKEALS